MYPSKDNPGFGVFVKNIVEGLHDNNIFSSYLSVIVGRGNSVFEKLWKYIKFYISILKNYFKDYDYIYVHFPTYVAPIIYILQSINKRGLIVNFHGEDLMYFEYSRLQRILGKLSDRMVRQYADMIVVPSEFYKKIVLERGLGEESKVFVSPSGGVDTSLFTKTGMNVVQEDLSFIHIGFVGRLDPLKGLLEFIDACMLLSKESKIQVTIIGYGSLKNKVDDICKNNSFVTAIYGIDQKELPSWYNRFDVLVFPSKRESLGLVGVEAMACGTPVIGSNIPGILSYLKDGYNGFVVRQENLSSDIVKCIDAYKKLSREEKEKMSMNCLDTAKAFSHDNVCRNLAHWFLENN